MAVGDRLVRHFETTRKKEETLKDETIAIHGGYESEPATKAVAVPIYQTVSYEFDDAQHGADLSTWRCRGIRAISF